MTIPLNRVRLNSFLSAVLFAVVSLTIASANAAEPAGAAEERIAKVRADLKSNDADPVTRVVAHGTLAMIDVEVAQPSPNQLAEIGHRLLGKLFSQQ